MRGGTSKGPVILASDLPEETEERDAVLLSLMGAGHELEIDGIGGGSPQTSKVAIVSPSDSPDADVDYLFAQVMVNERRVDTTPNCGNMLCAVGPFAIEKGLVKAQSPVTTVRIRNLNTGTLVDAEVQTPDYRVVYEGDTQIDGVPGTAAPIGLTFLNSAGSKTGKLLPTDSVTNVFDGIEVTCIDMAMPMVLIDASAWGKREESPAELDADRRLSKAGEPASSGGEAMGLGDVSNKVIPKPVLLSRARTAERFRFAISCRTPVINRWRLPARLVFRPRRLLKALSPIKLSLTVQKSALPILLILNTQVEKYPCHY
jgi:2-methylaconitate cis-trans-isomerase PrpF